MIDGWGISSEIALRWKSEDLNDDKSALGQAMAWCCQATSHNLSQCWSRSMMPYGVIRPQRVDAKFKYPSPSYSIIISCTNALENNKIFVNDLSYRGMHYCNWHDRLTSWRKANHHRVAHHRYYEQNFNQSISIILIHNKSIFLTWPAIN